MSHRALPSGKLSSDLLGRLLADLHRARADVLLGPAIGEDAGVIDIAGGALVAAADPITLTGHEIGGHAVLINANDVAVMGVRPQWFLAVLLLPIGTTEAEVAVLFADMQAALDRLDVALVGGHSEVTPAVSQPVVVGQMLGFQPDGRFLRTGGVRAEDAILQIGMAPIEGAAILSFEAAERLQDIDPALLARARDGMKDPGISVVEPALRAAGLGATALHDPTEGGLSAGLYEMAEASGLALRIDLERALWFAPGQVICAELGADPWGVLASGTLLAAFPPDLAERALSILVAEGHPTARIARAEVGSGIRTDDGRRLPRYEQDELSRILAPPSAS